jgi:hypothetical protein
MEYEKLTKDAFLNYIRQLDNGSFIQPEMTFPSKKDIYDLEDDRFYNIPTPAGWCVMSGKFAKELSNLIY